MKRRTLTVTAAAAAVLLAAAAFSGPGSAHGPGGGAYYGGPGMMGPMGYGMMGPGRGGGRHGQMGRGWMGYGRMAYGPGPHEDCPMYQAALGQELSVEDVTELLERRLDWMDNDRLELGEVRERGEDAIVGEIVTKDGSLVERLVFDRRSGRVTRSE
jgi:hypothetical protein